MKSLTHEELVAAIFKLLEPELNHGQAGALAARVGMKQPTFSSYKIGRRTPSLEVCARLAKVVGYEVFLALWPIGAKTKLDADLAQKWDRLPETKNGINAAATETNCFGDTSIKSILSLVDSSKFKFF